MKTLNNISSKLNKKYGKFSYELIYVNKEAKNYVYKLYSKKGTFVIKLINGKDVKERIENEIVGRKYFKKQILPKLKRIRITELDDCCFKDKYIITKYEKITSLAELAKKNPKEFLKIIKWIYTIYFKKIKELGKNKKPKPTIIRNLNKYPKKLRKQIIELNKESIALSKNRKSYTLYGEFSLYDLNYKKPNLYLIDFEDLKKDRDYLIDYVDLYAKIFKIHIKLKKKIYKKALELIGKISKKKLTKQELKIFKLLFKIRLLKFYLQDPKYRKQYLSAFEKA